MFRGGSYLGEVGQQGSSSGTSAVGDDLFERMHEEVLLVRILLDLSENKWKETLDIAH